MGGNISSLASTVDNTPVNGYDDYVNKYKDQLGYTPTQEEYQGMLADGTSLMMPQQDSILSAFTNMFGNKGSFGNSLPGYLISAFSALDQNKTNKLNRKATQYALDRKKAEDNMYDKYQKNWSGIKFS